MAEPGLTGWLLAPVLLLVIRPLAVAIAFAWSTVPRPERAFVGLFGIRGIGSFYYVAVAIGSGAMSPGDASIVYWTVLVCVGLSIVVHGTTATPVTRRLMEGRGGR